MYKMNRIRPNTDLFGNPLTTSALVEGDLLPITVCADILATVNILLFLPIPSHANRKPTWRYIASMKTYKTLLHMESHKNPLWIWIAAIQNGVPYGAPHFKYRRTVLTHLCIVI